jgi:hypothetical protein
LLVKKVGDLGNRRDHRGAYPPKLNALWFRLNCCGGLFGIDRCESLGLSTLAADMIFVTRSASSLVIVNNVGEQSFAPSVWCARIHPEIAEICGHRDEPLADRFVKDQILSFMISVFSRSGQQSLRVRNKAMVSTNMKRRCASSAST